MTESEPPEYLQATIIAVENGYLVCTNDKQYVFDTLGEATAKLLLILGQLLKKELWPLLMDDINDRILDGINPHHLVSIKERETK